MVYSRTERILYVNSYVFLSSVLALVLYVPLCIQLLSGKVKQNLATWLLWSILDGVAAGTLIVQGGNFWLATTYTLGSAVATLCILKSKMVKWTWFENFVSLLVIICIIVWISSGSKVATIASTLAMFIAGIPQLIETMRKPHETPILIYFGYFIANSLSILGGKDWTIQERFYSSSAAIYCFILVLFAMRKLFLGSREALREESHSP